MKLLFIQYEKCGTCRKAKKWLDENKLQYESRSIINDVPTYEELSLWIEQSGLPLKRFFNTSGQQYRALELKDRLPAMSEEEQLRLLASDGMLVKRPVLVLENGKVLTGFKENEWEEALL